MGYAAFFVLWQGGADMLVFRDLLHVVHALSTGPSPEMFYETGDNLPII